MLLRRLELQGFKSFADKITLDLSHRVTAIVGPNGSGKSNITDSIRWLLGERDARNLRGGKGEDLIFAGTKDKPRSGMAQATLHFDNSSGALPVEYKDLAISRKVSGARRTMTLSSTTWR
ncbi:MAG: Chromosome partition protein Smc [Parcubacteria group bacterium GW2011_GWA2_46_10]|nr:MAG: Chromosome partition protein Smc [Parcubacteria group bacterium GW2011_GWA2_46_10]